MRYFAEIAYNGTRFFGWQRQNDEVTVQGTIEKALSTMLNTPIWVTGCGRTDTGVNASYYVLHFDYDGSFGENFLFRLNNFICKDIAFKSIVPMHSDAHSRFDARMRSYTYFIDFEKNPFHQETAYFLIAHARMDLSKLQQAADIIKSYKAFYPFCKTHSGVKSYDCNITRAEWVFDHENKQLRFHISANRFLRGMVRMIVGECFNIALGKSTLEELQYALETQTRLKKATPAAPQALFLSEIQYPYPIGESIQTVI
jgi:tRNA pseudouridine38-40 synthase